MASLELTIVPKKGVRRLTWKRISDSTRDGVPIEIAYTSVGYAETLATERGISTEGVLTIHSRFIGPAGICGKGCTIRGFVFFSHSSIPIPVEVVARTDQVAGKITFLTIVGETSHAGNIADFPQKKNSNQGVFEYPPGHPALTCHEATHV